MSKVVIKANDMSPQMSKFATKVGVEALQNAQTEQVGICSSFILYNEYKITTSFKRKKTDTLLLAEKEKVIFSATR